MLPSRDRQRGEASPLTGGRAGDASGGARGNRMAVLDGWRAVSILLVLACHMLPLGPRPWQLNAAAGPAGMALFFTLSGFLITSTLHRDPCVLTFLIRRLFRIVPLALLAAPIYLAAQGKGLGYLPAHVLFYVNYDHAHLTPLAGHYWSLCVEVQFYLAAALLIAAFGRRGLALLVPLGVAVTLLRVRQETPISIVTHLRVDEILAGVALALAWLGALGRAGHVAVWAVRSVPLPAWAAAFAVSCHPVGGAVQYARPYLAASLVGHTLWSADFINVLLQKRLFRYIAEISYALYIVHQFTMYGWLGSGETAERYLKRPLCFALTFGLAHLSTFAYERRWIALGKRLSRR